MKLPFKMPKLTFTSVCWLLFCWAVMFQFAYSCISPFQDDSDYWLYNVDDPMARTTFDKPAVVYLHLGDRIPLGHTITMRRVVTIEAYKEYDGIWPNTVQQPAESENGPRVFTKGTHRRTVPFQIANTLVPGSCYTYRTYFIYNRNFILIDQVEQLPPVKICIVPSNMPLPPPEGSHS